MLLSPEESELKPLCVASNDDERIDPKEELKSLCLGSKDDMEDDGDNPVTPERIEPKSASKKSNSVGELRILNPNVAVKARYLDTSSGSCHDFCKYGHKNIKESTSSFIAKQKKLVASSMALSEPNVAKKKIDMVPKLSLSPANSTIKRASSISTTSDKSDKKLNDVVQVNPMGDLLSKGKKKELVPPKAPLAPKSSIKRELKEKSQNVKDLKEVSHLRKHSISVGKGAKKQSLNEKKLGGDGNEMQNNEQMCFENKKGKQKSPGAVTTQSSLISRNKNLGLEKDQNSLSKLLKRVDGISTLVSHNKNLGLKRDQNALSKSLKRVAEISSLISGNKNLGLKRGQNALSKPIKRVDGISSSEGSDTKAKKQMPKEKVELVSRPKRVGKKVGLEEEKGSTHKLAFKRGKVLDIKPNSTAPRRLKFKPRKAVSEDLNSKADDKASSKTEPVKQMTNHKVGINTQLKSENSAHKLNFERIKVIDSQPKNTAPRRLKFKPRKVKVENVNGDNSQRNLKNFFGADEMKGTDNEHLRVVLKHQDVEGKKDVQSLLNNVIEETAMRLARLRKSKVKALVGAFESLMSLPDAKSSTTSAS